MSVTAALETISQRAAEQKQECQQRYDDLVHQLADGLEPDGDLVHVVVTESGKTIDQLQNDVQRLCDRREMRLQLDSVGDLEREKKANEQTIEQAAAELTAAKAKYESDTKAARASNAWLRQEVARCRRLKLDLRRTASPELHQAVEVIEAELESLWQAILSTSQQKQKATEMATHLRLGGDHQGNRLRDSERAVKIETYNGLAAEHAATEKALRERQDELKSQRDAIELRMLEP